VLVQCFIMSRNVWWNRWLGIFALHDLRSLYASNPNIPRHLTTLVTHPFTTFGFLNRGASNSVILLTGGEHPCTPTLIPTHFLHQVQSRSPRSPLKPHQCNSRYKTHANTCTESSTDNSGTYRLTISKTLCSFVILSIRIVNHAHYDGLPL